jgi:hypothetical protein
MSNIARGEGCLAGDGDACDLDVADVYGAAGVALLRCKAPAVLDGDGMERQDATLEILRDRLGESLVQLPAAPPVRPQLQSQPDFEHSNGGHPHRIRRARSLAML